MSREGEEHVLVVFRPPTEESILNVVVEQPSDRDGRPNVRHVIGGPNKSAVQEDGGMEVLENLPLLAKEVKRNREEGTEEETP